MKLKNLLLALAVTLGTLAAQAQDLNMLTREQAREVVNMICQSSGSLTNQQSIEETLGVSGVQNINTIINDSTLEMKYILPDYNMGNSPADKAFSMLCLSAGGRQMSSPQINMMTGIFEKAGYNLRIVYTDGDSHTCVVDITPDRLNKLWKGDLRGAEVDRDLAVQGILDSLEAGANTGNSPGDIKDVKVSLEGRWATMSMTLEKDSMVNFLSPDEVKQALLTEYASSPIVSKLAAALLPNSDFIGIDGIKVAYGSDNDNKRDVYISWGELMTNH